MVTEKRRVQRLRLRSQEAGADLDSGGDEAPESSAPNPRVGVPVGGHDATHSRGDDALDAGRRPAGVAAGLEIHVEGRVRGRRCREHLRFGVRPPGAGVEGLGQHPAAPHEDGAHGRIGGGGVAAEPGELERPAQEAGVHGLRSYGAGVRVARRTAPGQAFRMFTGLVAARGAVTAVERRADGIRRIEVRETGGTGLLEETRRGDSVAVSGVCLTVVARAGGGRLARFDVAEETLSRSTLGDLGPGAEVNLELPLRAGDRLGGHFVQGHVDAVGEIAEAGGTAEDYRLCVTHAEPRWIVEKGSVALDGVSLTVAAADPPTGRFEVMLIPHTREVTTLGRLRPGSRVNIEYDILAKYVAQAAALAPVPAAR